MSDASQLRLRRVQAVAYQVTSDGRSSPAKCFLVELRGVDDSGNEFVGFGEGQPRGSLTGDRLPTSWVFLTECLRQLHMRELQIANHEKAIGTVRSLMDEFRALRASAADSKLSLHGTLLGLEAALLNLFANVHRTSVERLLGATQTAIPVQATPISALVTESQLRSTLAKQADRTPATCLFGTADPEANLARLMEASAVNRSSSVNAPNKPLWIDVNGRLSRRDARRFVNSTVNAMSDGQLPSKILIEHPVGIDDYGFIPRLQRLADRRLASRGFAGTEIHIMADPRSRVPTTRSRRASWKSGARQAMARTIPGAVMIRPAQVGGVLASVDLANDLNASHPDTEVYVGSMLGGSRVSAATTHAIGLAIPSTIAVVHEALSDLPEDGSVVEAAVDHDMLLAGATDMFSLPAPRPPTHRGRQANVYPEVEYLRPLGSNGTKGHLLEREALARGLSTVRYSKGAFTATDGAHEPLSFKWSRSPLSSAVSLALCTHKEATRIRLNREGLPVPQGMTFAAGAYDTARAFVHRIGYPVVVKPAMGVRGIGVVANITDDNALEAAFNALESSKLGGGDFIVEKHVEGQDYRIVVIGDEVIGAILRKPGSVIGDGERTVAELVIAKNIARRENPHLWGRPIKPDSAMRIRLAQAGISPGYVPKDGEEVVLSTSCSLSQGGESVDVLDELHPDIKEAAVRAVKAIPQLAFCGVDFLIEDHTKPLTDQQSGICELNAHAAIGNCEYPLYGAGRQVARTLIDACIDRFGLKATERSNELALKLLIRGRVTGVGYREWIQRRARTYGLKGWVRNVDNRTVEAVVVGGVEPATALTAAAVLGPRRAIPTDVTTTHIASPPDVRDFEIKRSWRGARR